MKLNELLDLINKLEIPEDVHIMSDSGWECDATEMDGVFYNRKINTIVFTQDGRDEDVYSVSKGWLKLSG